jgi:hypothetical protein
MIVSAFIAGDQRRTPEGVLRHGGNAVDAAVTVASRWPDVPRRKHWR